VCVCIVMIHLLCPWLPQVSDAFPCVGRLFEGNVCIGTCVRLNSNIEGGKVIVLAARHCVVDGGMCLPNIRAFGGKLEVGGRVKGSGLALSRPNSPS
jgi:hypothetical protein